MSQPTYWKCSQCHGLGRIADQFGSESCSWCAGAGFLPADEQPTEPTETDYEPTDAEIEAAWKAFSRIRTWRVKDKAVQAEAIPSMRRALIAARQVRP